MGLSSLFGWKKERQQTLDLRTVTDNPVDAARLAGDGLFIIDVPVEKIRVLDFVGADPDNPFVVTLREYAEGRCDKYTGSPLENFYRCWQPFAPGQPREEDDSGPPWRTVRPKARNTPAGRLQRHEFREAARDLGFSPDEIVGHIKGGPVTEAFGEITFRRLSRLHDSISRDGFLPESSLARYPTGFCFVRDGDYRVSIGSGKHRVLVMLALGWTKIPVELGPPKLPVITRREEADRWPNVINGRYTLDEALRRFDDIFRQRHPSGWKMSRG
jgi:hypothetical protein